MGGWDLQCEGYSTARYLWEHYPELHDFLKPIVEANKCTRIYPCYLKVADDTGKEYYVLRFMGKGKTPIYYTTDRNKKLVTIIAVTRKVPVEELDLNELYEYRELQ